MTADWSIDANILIYLVDADDESKWTVAGQVMHAARAARILLPRQTIGEFYNAAVKKRYLARPEAAEIAREYLDFFETFPASHDAIATALAEAETGRTQFWDAVLLAACAEKKIDLLLTEDMAQGPHRLGVEIVNPFAPTPSGRKILKKRGISAR